MLLLLGTVEENTAHLMRRRDCIERGNAKRMERIVWRGRLRPWNLVIYRIGATMYREPALNSVGTLPQFRAVVNRGGGSIYLPLPKAGREHRLEGGEPTERGLPEIASDPRSPSSPPAHPKQALAGLQQVAGAGGQGAPCLNEWDPKAGVARFR